MASRVKRFWQKGKITYAKKEKFETVREM